MKTFPGIPGIQGAFLPQRTWGWCTRVSVIRSFYLGLRSSQHNRCHAVRKARFASSLPDEIRLPAPEQVAAFRSQARALVAKDRKPFGFVILAVIFGAMPLVDGAD